MKLTHHVIFMFLLLQLVPACAAPPKLEPANLSLNAYRRIFPAGKPAELSLSTYNLRRVTFSVHPVDIEDLIPNTAVLDAEDSAQNPASVRGRIKRMALAAPLKSWAVTVKDFYPNDWRYRGVKLPALPEGVYVVQASGGGVSQRTWFAVSSRALITKRSPDVVTAWLVTTDGRTTPAGVPLTLYNATGRLMTVTTGKDGLATFPVSSNAGALWVAARAGAPAFARAGDPGDEKPYRIFLYTDRPIYRPGQLVHFTGTVRAVTRGTYQLPTEKRAHVQIKTHGDVVVYDEMLPLNEWGSFAGDFQLAPEPPLGHYSLEVELPDYREYSSFAVEAYRKPDFTVNVVMPGEHLLGGKPMTVKIDAKYFFGSPVSGGTVRYSVSYDQVSSAPPSRIFTAAGLGSSAVGEREESFSGQGRLDKDGKLELVVPTHTLPYDRSIRVQATVTDLSLRSGTGQGSMRIQGAQFHLSVRPSTSQYQPGARVPVTVQATDYDGKPVRASVTVVLIEQRTDREHRTVEERTEHKVSTGADGIGTAQFTVERPGGYRIEAWSLDTERNPVYAATDFYVTTQKPTPAWPALDIAPTAETYHPGETAQLRVRTNLVGHKALLTVEGERLYVTRVVDLAKKEFLIALPVQSAYMPGVSIRLNTVQDNGYMQTAYAELSVPAAHKELTIRLTPDKTTYRPGETANYTVQTLDRAGKGVPAEVGVGVVDTALYAIRADHTANPYNLFWFPQPDRIETDFSLSATYPGGAYQHIPGIPAHSPQSGMSDTPVRKQFEDTAFWAASVVTDANGQGRVSFTLPDNLTTWRMTARALTKTTDAGQQRDEVTVTQPLMARLVLPRFYTQGDKATAAALVHNYTGVDRQVRVALTATGAQIADPAEQIINLPANGIARVTWTVTASGQTGDAEHDNASFLVSADGGDGARDAMQSTVPVHPNGVRRVDAIAGMTTETTAVAVTLPPAALPGASQLELTLSPSLAGPMFEALDYLAGYPYGCAEQTMEQFLPDVIVARTLHTLGVVHPAPPKLDRYVNFGIQKLLRYQHDDGGWHWWENDDSDPFMTAYIVYGLAMARDAGYPLAAGPLPNGIGYLEAELPDAEHIYDRAAATYLLWALAYADGWSDDDAFIAAVRVAKRLYADREKLDTFSQASLALALQRMSTHQGAPTDFSAMARKLADGLEAAAVATGVTAVHWTAHATECGSWRDNEVEVTAQVLQALLAIKPQSAKIVPAVRWLMSARRGRQWTSTKDTAAAVLALTAYLQQAKELAPDYTVTVRSGGQELKTVTFTPAQAFAASVRITIPAEKLVPGANTLTLEKSGAGTLYWTAQLAYVLPVDGLQPLARGVSVTREYHVVKESPVDAGTQVVGDMVQVSVTITADQPLHYVMLAEPIPAGCEIVNSDGNGCDRVDVWDNRLVFFFDALPRGERTVSYWLRTEAPGRYNIAPATAELVYQPDVRGESRTAQMKVVE